MVETIAAFLLGLFLWTLIEYAIHGWFGHLSTTFAARLHAVHHRDPNAIFTIGAWLPLTILYSTSLGLFDLSPTMIVCSGALGGFVVYETIHYRIHFVQPRGRLERWLREHHLTHHQRMPNRCFGVTSPLWDIIFGTEPDRDRRQLFASVRAVKPLTGRTNIRLLCTFHFLRRS